MPMPSSRRRIAAGTVLAGLMLGGCASKIDTPVASDTDASDTDRPGSSDPYVDPPNSEATYGVPATDSDWWGTGSSSSGDGPETDTDTDTDSDSDSDSDSGSGSDSDSDSDTDTDTDTDTDGPATATGGPSSDAG